MDSNTICMGCRLKDSLMLITCGQADVIEINHSSCCGRVCARAHTHTHTHTCKQSHFHIFKTVFLSLFGFEKSIFRYITMKKVWCYMV